LFTDPETAAARRALHAHWRETGAFRGETLLEVVERAAREDPDAQLVLASDTHAGVTRVGDLPARTRAVAAAFAAIGVRKGDVVAMQLPNWPMTLEAYLGAVAAGAVLVPIVHTYGPAETGFILEQSGASVLVSSAASVASARTSSTAALRKWNVVPPSIGIDGRGAVWVRT